MKWVRGEALSPEHWLDLFRIMKLPRGTTLEKLTFGDIIKSKNEIIKNSEQIKELNVRAQAEHSIREALRELVLHSNAPGILHVGDPGESVRHGRQRDGGLGAVGCFMSIFID